MSKTLKITAYACCLSFLFNAGCSSGDEPEPFDCGTSDLSIELIANQDVSDCNATDGVIEVAGSGGEEPYQFKLENGAFQSSGIFTGLPPGSHIVAIKDANACEVLLENIVIGITGSTLTAGASATEDSECLSDNGSVTVNASGGVSPYLYKLGNGTFGSSEVFTNLSNGTKTISIKDAENCTITINVNVPRANTGITYTGDIREIFVAKCDFDGCHPENGDWLNYTTAKNSASSIKAQTSNGSMPRSPFPGGPLSAEEKALIACWVDDGAPQN